MKFNLADVIRPVGGGLFLVVRVIKREPGQYWLVLDPRSAWGLQPGWYASALIDEHFELLEESDSYEIPVW